MLHHDPLLAFEKKQKHKTFFASIRHTMKFLVSYLFVSGLVFVVLLSVLNFSAYSTRIANYIDPDALLAAREQVEGILSSSNIEVHASESLEAEKSESLESVTEKLLTSSPEIVYKDTYTAEELLAGVSESSKKTSFSRCHDGSPS
jgi:hypothetical protein